MRVGGLDHDMFPGPKWLSIHFHILVSHSGMAVDVDSHCFAFDQSFI